MKKDIMEMLSKYKHLWSGRAGIIKATHYVIDLIEGLRPIRRQLYQARQRSLEMLCEHIAKQLEAGIIELAQSEGTRLILLVPKKGGTFRFCVAYLLLNADNTPCTYPLPRIDDYNDSLGEAQVFTALDALCGFWMVLIKDVVSVPFGSLEKNIRLTYSGHEGSAECR